MTKLLLLLVTFHVGAQQVVLSWPTNYGPVTVQYSTDMVTWQSITQGNFTSFTISATNAQSATVWNPDAFVWVADSTPHNFYRIRWDYTNTGYWVGGTDDTFTKNHQGPRFEFPPLSNIVQFQLKTAP